MPCAGPRQFAATLCLALLLALALRASRLAAQSQSDLAAWNALMLSPVGALPPLAHEGVDGDTRRNELTVRYGYWRYDINDVAHNNIGVTFAHAFDFAHTEVALTGAELWLACGSCSPWFMGGVAVQSTLWEDDLAGSPARPLAGTLGLRETVAAARYVGTDHSVALSTAVAVAVGLDVPFVFHTYLHATLLPGLGFGAFDSPDLNAQGVRPTWGGALAWSFGPGLSVSGGFQRIVLSGAPTEVGGGFSWRFGRAQQAKGQ
jgi:hypothetical protein